MPVPRLSKRAGGIQFHRYSGRLFHVAIKHDLPPKGIGVPVVVQWCTSLDEFQQKQASFVASVILSPNDEKTSSNIESFALEFHNPLVASSVTIKEVRVPMASDKSAAIAKMLRTTKRNYIQDFLKPGNVAPDDEGLFMLEPYVEGKIPVVLVHGLLSDSLTWANLVNEIRGRPWFSDRFQIWEFEYAIGKPFLSSAAILRKQLTQLCCRVDPDDTDQALRHIVLVGHSMGGLISKLLVSNSQDDLWNSIATRQLEEVSIVPPFRETLADSMFFDPVEAVDRVIYIGTPYRGSVCANRAVGRIGSPHLRSHSIIGSGRWMPGNGD